MPSNATDQPEPRVSVLLPVYNDTTHLREAVQSLLDQTLQEFELLVLDDGSDVPVKDIIDSFGDARIRYNRVSHGGLTKTLNRGLAMCRARYVARQDADDVSSPDRLTRQVEFLDTNPEVVLIGSNCWHIDDAGAILTRSRYPLKHETIVRYMQKIRNPFPHSAVMFRKHTVLARGGYDERFPRVQDYELWLRLIQDGRVAILDAPLCAIRYRRDSVSKSAGPAIQRRYAMLAYVLYLRRRNALRDMSDSQWRAFIVRFDHWSAQKFNNQSVNLWQLRLELGAAVKNRRGMLAVQAFGRLIAGIVRVGRARRDDTALKKFLKEWVTK